MYTYQDILNIIEKELQNIALPAHPDGLYTPIRYLLSNGGKRLRPCLAMLSANVFSDDVQPAVSPALAIEMFHNFTLMHDDIMDNASLRRGKKTVHEQWGINTAILSGDAMLVKAYELLASLQPDVLPIALYMFNKTALEVCEGQQLDTAFEQMDFVSSDEYITMITLKTSVLLGCSAFLGALVVNADKKHTEGMYQFGLHLGISFQIQDDVLDVYATDALFGKKTGGDIARNKKTYLWLTLLEKMDASEKHHFNTVLVNQPEQDKINSITRLYDAYQVRESAEEAIQKHYNLALEALHAVDAPAERKHILVKLADDMLHRTF
jgi:geranylgeranyl diphosphate synthase type II